MAPSHAGGHDGPQPVTGDAAVLRDTLSPIAVAMFRSPDRLSPEKVRALQLQLIGQHRSWSRISQTVSALRCCFGVILGRSDTWGGSSPRANRSVYQWCRAETERCGSWR